MDPATRLDEKNKEKNNENGKSSDKTKAKPA
jgi:hypothetical protein